MSFVVYSMISVVVVVLYLLFLRHVMVWICDFMVDQKRREYIEYHEALGPLSIYFNQDTGNLEIPEDRLEDVSRL